MGTKLPWFFGLSVVALLGFSNTARADAPATQPLELLPSSTPTTAPSNYPETGHWRYPDTVVHTYYDAPPSRPEFARNDFELSLGGQGFTAHGSNGNDSIGFITFEGDYFFANTLSIGLEVGIAPGTFDNHHHHHHHDDDSDEDNGVRAVEEMALLRWHFLTVGALSLYADGGVGGMHASPALPGDGRRDNFLAAVGGGLSARFTPHFYGGLGARAAWLSGGDHDSFHHDHHWSDGVQYYGELSFIFP